jgi:hypothetical protein
LYFQDNQPNDNQVSTFEGSKSVEASIIDAKRHNIVIADANIVATSSNKMADSKV